MNGRLLVVALLIKKGADIDIYCYDELEHFGCYFNFKAIDIAAVNRHIDVVKLLYNSGANMNNALYFAAAGGSLDCIQFLLDIGCDVNPVDHSPLCCMY